MIFIYKYDLFTMNVMGMGEKALKYIQKQRKNPPFGCPPIPPPVYKNWRPTVFQREKAGAITPDQSEHRSNGNESVLYITQSSRPGRFSVIGLFSVISRKLVGDGVLHLCQDAVDEFYSPSQLDSEWIGQWTSLLGISLKSEMNSEDYFSLPHKNSTIMLICGCFVYSCPIKFGRKIRSLYVINDRTIYNFLKMKQFCCGRHPRIGNHELPPKTV